MENTATNSPSRRGKSLKFDQEWKDAVDRLPKHYRDEICAAIESYQRDLTVIEVTPGVPRAIFMLIMPTIRRLHPACHEPYSCSSCPQSAAAIAHVNCVASPAPARLRQNPLLQAVVYPGRITRRSLSRHNKPQTDSQSPNNPKSRPQSSKRPRPTSNNRPRSQSPHLASSLKQQHPPPRQQPEAVPAKAHSRNYCATSTPVITARNTEQVLKPSASKKNSIFFGICCSFFVLIASYVQKRQINR